VTALDLRTKSLYGIGAHEQDNVWNIVSQGAAEIAAAKHRGWEGATALSLTSGLDQPSLASPGGARDSCVADTVGALVLRSCRHNHEKAERAWRGQRRVFRDREELLDGGRGVE